MSSEDENSIQKYEKLINNDNIQDLNNSLFIDQVSTETLCELCRYAACRDKFDVVNLLINQHNYDLNQDPSIISCCAMGFGSVKMMDHLIKNNANISCINDIFRNGDIMTQICRQSYLDANPIMIQLLFNHGYDIKSVDFCQVCRLIIRPNGNHVNAARVIEIFIQNGADLNINNGLPLFLAIKNKNLECIKLLLQCGANPDLLENLVANDKNPMVDILVDSGISPVTIYHIFANQKIEALMLQPIDNL